MGVGLGRVGWGKGGGVGWGKGVGWALGPWGALGRPWGGGWGGWGVGKGWLDPWSLFALLISVVTFCTFCTMDPHLYGLVAFFCSECASIQVLCHSSFCRRPQAKLGAVAAADSSAL